MVLAISNENTDSYTHNEREGDRVSVCTKGGKGGAVSVCMKSEGHESTRKGEDTCMYQVR